MAGFDPYRKWLGIPPNEQPPNHYRLLGIGLFESDPEVIVSAAGRQISYVQGFRAGEHAEAAQFLINELAAAQARLLDPRQRAEYDQTLRQAKSAARTGAAARAASAPATAPPARAAWSSPPPLAKPNPRIVAAPPPPAADFLSRVLTPTHHEARLLKHKKETDVGTVAVAAGLIGFCAIAVILMVVYYFNQSGGSGEDQLFGPARPTIKVTKPKAVKRSSDGEGAVEGRKSAPVSRTNKSGPPVRSPSTGRPAAQSGDDLPPGPYNNRSAPPSSAPSPAPHSAQPPAQPKVFPNEPDDMQPEELKPGTEDRKAPDLPEQQH